MALECRVCLLETQDCVSRELCLYNCEATCACRCVLCSACYEAITTTRRSAGSASQRVAVVLIDQQSPTLVPPPSSSAPTPLLCVVKVAAFLVGVVVIAWAALYFVAKTRITTR